jgi:RHS repeat-associated protein
MIKLHLKLMLPALMLLALFSTPNLASAYYDPGVQRWINRDPVKELGHFLIRYGNSVQMGLAERNLYEYVRNSPVDLLDPLGLTERPWPANGVACNGCSDGSDVYILVEGEYFTLPAGECTASQPGVGKSTDVDGVWVCPPAGECQFNRVNPGLSPFIACAPPPQNCPSWNGDPKSKNSPRNRGAPTNKPPRHPLPPTYRSPGPVSPLP